MAAKPKLTPEGLQWFLGVLRAREAIPSDKEVARELGVTVSALYQARERLQSMLHDLTVSPGSKYGNLGRACRAQERSPTIKTKGS